MNENCMVCQRIEKTKQGENPYFVKELEPEFRKKFLEEMSLVGEAVYKAFKPDKLNYELLGIGNAVHMHWHFFPRREGDTPEKGPVWKLDKAEMYAEKYRPNTDELENLKAALLVELNKLESIEGLGF